MLLVQVELAQQLLPALRLDGYFILTDLVGVPDLFRKIGPVLRSLVPGQRPIPGWAPCGGPPGSRSPRGWR